MLIPKLYVVGRVNIGSITTYLFTPMTDSLYNVERNAVTQCLIHMYNAVRDRYITLRLPDYRQLVADIVTMPYGLEATLSGHGTTLGSIELAIPNSLVERTKVQVH